MVGAPTKARGQEQQEGAPYILRETEKLGHSAVRYLHKVALRTELNPTRSKESGRD